MWLTLLTKSYSLSLRKSALSTLLLLLIFPNQSRAIPSTPSVLSEPYISRLINIIQNKNKPKKNTQNKTQKKTTEKTQVVTSNPFFSDLFYFTFDTKPIDEAFVDDSNAFILPWKSSIFQANNDPSVDIQLNTYTNKSNSDPSYSVLAEHYLGPLKSTFFISGDNDLSVENMQVEVRQVY
ncbi:hypothetical protein JI57_02925 [Psychromonas sp. PRT-SC03]|nr:hypothetical protein JI57_02925 [Psychromonas sp. PRT-SC03]